MDIFNQINSANNLNKLNIITMQRITQLVAYIRACIRFASIDAEFEGVAIAALAKSIGTSESIIILLRRQHIHDAQILVRSLMEATYRTIWMLADDDLREKRLAMLYYQEAYGKLNQLTAVVNEEPENMLAARIPQAKQEVEMLRAEMSRSFPDLKFSEAGKLRVGLSFDDILKGLDLKLQYPLIYTELSSTVHSDVRSLAKHATLMKDRVSYSVHPKDEFPGAEALTTHLFLHILASNVDLNLSRKLAPDFQAKMEQEHEVNGAVSARWNALLEKVAGSNKVGKSLGE